MGRKTGRHRKLLIILMVFLSLCVFTGCSSITSLIKANFSGMPFWYYEPDSGAGKGNTGMVAEGIGIAERQAELLAYTNLIAILSDRVGYDLGSEAYRELSVMGTLSDFDLYIEDHHVTTGADGNYHYYLHAVMDKELLDNVVAEGKAAGVEYDEKGFQEGLKMIKLQLKGLLARDLWDTSEYFQILNQVNPIVQKGLELLEE